MKTRALFAAPLVVAIALHAWASGAYAQDAFAAALTLAAIPLGGRVRVSSAVQRVLATAFFVTGAAMGWAHVPELGYGPGTLPRAASLVAVGSLLAAASRFYVRASFEGERATFVLGMLAVAASGATRLGPLYGAFCAVFLALAFFALRLRDPARARAEDLASRHRATLLGLVALAAALTTGFTRAAPKLHDRVQRAFDDAYARNVVGFTGGTVRLGSMRDAIESDEEVLRVAPPPHAAPIDYLRGAIYDEYEKDGTWDSSDAIGTRSRRLATMTDAVVDAMPGATFRARRVAGDWTHYFLPLRARGLSVPSGRVVVDGGGVARSAGDDRVRDYAFVTGERDDLASRPPTRLDLVVPWSERRAVEQLAREWTQGATTPEERLVAISRRLARDYTYSLSAGPEDAEDPLLDFLFASKAGYCTYFASAMVLLARASGVPARLVAGYRVAEWSPVAREWVVRQKNAHAWVEAWLGDANGGVWRTFDPTPIRELPQDAPHVASLGTLAADALDRVEQAVTYTMSHVTPAQLVGLLGVLVAMWYAVRALRARARRATTAAGAGRAERPLPCYERLAQALEKSRGLAREPSEPLERFAARLADAGLEDAAALVQRYAALRYGGRGDVASLDRDVARFVERAGAR